MCCVTIPKANAEPAPCHKPARCLGAPLSLHVSLKLAHNIVFVFSILRVRRLSLRQVKLPVYQWWRWLWGPAGWFSCQDPPPQPLLKSLPHPRTPHPQVLLIAVLNFLGCQDDHPQHERQMTSQAFCSHRDCFFKIF